MSNSVVVDKREQFNIRYNIVTPEYLETMGIPLLLGRRFSDQDNAASPRVAIINETFARYAWPNENPVGRYFDWKDRVDQRIEVIGVARDAKSQDLFKNPPSIAYFPLAQRYDGGMTLHLRSSIKPEQLVAAVQQEIRTLDPKLPIYNVQNARSVPARCTFRKALSSHVDQRFRFTCVGAGKPRIVRGTVAQRRRAPTGDRDSNGAWGIHERCITTGRKARDQTDFDWNCTRSGGRPGGLARVADFAFRSHRD